MRFTMPKRPKHALVLGCGPAGLFAAHGLVQNDWRVTILSRKAKSELFGCQYLHAPIPGLTDGLWPEDVTYRLDGDPAGYREKVYGTGNVTTSVETLEKDHQAWDIRTAYDRAWSLYSDAIEDRDVSPELMGIEKWDPNAGPVRPRTVMDPGRFDLVLNSIPLPSLCFGKHEFHSTEVWAMGDAPHRGQYVPLSVDPFTIVCDGTRDRGWYRASNVFGYKTVEWPLKSKPPLPGIARVTKPLWTDCVCYQEEYYTPWFNVGRYGTWTKGILAHHAYARAVSL